jgi:hypothetical protein
MKETAGKLRDIQIRVLIQLQRLLLLTLIPGPFPDMNRDVSSTPKKPIKVNRLCPDDSFHRDEQK